MWGCEPAGCDPDFPLDLTHLQVRYVAHLGVGVCAGVDIRGKFESESESRSGARHCARLRERKVAATSSGRVRASAAGSSRTRAHLPRERRRHLGSRCGLWICFAPRCAIVADLFCFIGGSSPYGELVMSLSAAVGACREYLLAFFMARVEIAESL